MTDDQSTEPLYVVERYALWRCFGSCEAELGGEDPCWAKLKISR
jgi:hypothetical protein